MDMVMDMVIMVICILTMVMVTVIQDTLTIPGEIG